MEIDIVSIVLLFIGGFGLFIFGMNYMGDSLQKVAGERMKSLIGGLTKNPLRGVAVGAVATALIQSSSASTVMVVGFVNAGIMNLKQAVGVLMGANIGTTTTAWIVALGDWVAFLKPSTLAPLCIAIGVGLMMISKKQNVNYIGQVLFGFGALFLGLDLMSDAVKPLRDLPQIKTLFITLGRNPLLGILVGAFVTVLVQSSSASIAILQTMAIAALIPWGAAIYIILGQNIGTCITAILSAIGATTNAKRAAAIHLIFNLIGTIIFAIIAIVSFSFIVPELSEQLITVTEIGIAHTAFNVLSTIILFPFAGGIVKLSEKVVKETVQKEEKKFHYLDERILETPSFAVQNAEKEVIRMGEMANENVKTALEALYNKDEEKIKQVFEKEKLINELQHGINEYLVKLLNVPLSEKEHYALTNLLHNVTDIERVGDHADNLAELAGTVITERMSFSDEATKELKELGTLALECVEGAIHAYELHDRSKVREVCSIEETIDKMEERVKAKHFKRMTTKECNPFVGAVYLDVISNLERISDHAANIALTALGDKVGDV